MAVAEGLPVIPLGGLYGPCKEVAMPTFGGISPERKATFDEEGLKHPHFSPDGIHLRIEPTAAAANNCGASDNPTWTVIERWIRQTSNFVMMLFQYSPCPAAPAHLDGAREYVCPCVPLRPEWGPVLARPSAFVASRGS